jgi:trigger factor
MQQTVESLGALERRIDLTVPAEAIDKEVQTRLNKLARTVKMPGFRPGKVPLKMIAQTYGAQVHAEVLNDKVGEAFSSAVSAGNLRVAGAPRLEPRTLEGSQDLAFSATFEVYPEIALGDLSGVEVQRAICSVGDAEVERTLEIMRKQRATYEDVDRAAADGDVATIDFKGTLDGTPFDGGTATDFPFTLGQGRMLPEFEAAVTGMRPGESKTFPLTFPADYTAKDLAGQGRAVRGHTEKAAATRAAPARSAVRQVARHRGRRSRQDAVRDPDQPGARGRVPAAGPDQGQRHGCAAGIGELRRAEVAGRGGNQRLAEAARNDMVARGVAAKDAPLPLELFAPQAERRVRLGLLLGEVVRTNNLQPRPDQIRKLVEEMAQSYERPQEVINWYLSDRKRLGELENVALEDNVTNWVLQRAKVTETTVAFDELMGHNAR